MSQATGKLTFEEYLSLDGHTGLPEGKCEFVDGELVELPPESEPNDFIANYLMFILASCGVVPLRLIRPGKCEIQVPILKATDPRTRYPDLVILREDHLPLTQRRLTITLDMPPPQMVAEVVSPGQINRDRDYKDKLAQYQQRGIPEYWLLDPEIQTVIVLELQSGAYVQVGRFYGSDRISSPQFSLLSFTTAEIFTGL